MRINAIIASVILAVTVSGAALPVPAAAAAPAVIGKREAEAGWNLPGRPYGLPIGKREADAEAGWKLPKRPFGLPIGKREADAEAGWKHVKRPFGLPIGKRDADATEE
jgi:mating pheromone alpha-factor